MIKFPNSALSQTALLNYLLKCCHASRRQCNIISFYAGMHFHIMLFLTRNLRYSQMNQWVAISWIWFHNQRSHKYDPLWYVRWWKIKGSNLKVKRSIFIRFNPRDKKINMCYMIGNDSLNLLCQWTISSNVSLWLYRQWYYYINHKWDL